MTKLIVNKYFVGVWFSLLLMVSCTDLDFLPEGVIEQTGAGPANENLASAYASLSEFANERTIFGLSGHSSDEMLGPTRGGDWFEGGVFQQMHLHQWANDNTFIITAWNELNTGIFRSGAAIAGDGATAQQIAEAKVLRAYFMFHVLDFWGLAVSRGPNDGGDVFPTVLTSAEATAMMIEDLESALPDLPAPGSPNFVNASTAHALLSKVYLNKAVFESDDRAGGSFTFASADMDKVIEHADAVSAAGYSISEGVVGYFETFAEANDQTSEMIFSIPRDRLVDFKRRFFNSTHYNHDHGGWNGFATLSDFYDSFEDSDIRRGGAYDSPSNPFTSTTNTNVGFLIGQQLGADGSELTTRNGDPLVYSRDVDVAVNTEEKGIRVLKYVPDYSGGVRNVDAPNNSYVLLRYGDVLMNKAEALFRKGDETAALDVINQLRSDRSSSMSSLGSIDADVLLAERGRELYWEGWRRNDLVRFGKFLDAWQLKEASPAHKIVFPIPPSAVLSNPNLDQNAGY
jgi:hypothetical protein